MFDNCFIFADGIKVNIVQTNIKQITWKKIQ